METEFDSDRIGSTNNLEIAEKRKMKNSRNYGEKIFVMQWKKFDQQIRRVIQPRKNTKFHTRLFTID
jgi:hypothetical protein